MLHECVGGRNSKDSLSDDRLLVAFLFKALPVIVKYEFVVKDTRILLVLRDLLTIDNSIQYNTVYMFSYTFGF